MDFLFGSKKKKEEPVNKSIQTLSDLNKNSTLLVEKSHDIKLKIENIEKELRTALESYRNARTNPEKVKAKKKAVQTLKKKKMYMAQLYNLEQASMNVENVSMQVEIAKDNTDIIKTLKQTNDLQKDLMKEMNVSTFDNLIDEMQDIQYNQQEFQDVMTRNYEIDLEDNELDEN